MGCWGYALLLFHVPGWISTCTCSNGRMGTCCLLLAETAPEAVARALQGPVQEALQHGQDEDRART